MNNYQTHTKQIYIRDAQGNVMAIYKDTHDSLMLEELHIYGSQRLGVIKENRLLAKYVNIFPPSSTFKTSMPNTPLIPYPYTLAPYHFGKKHYELTDWLGNVRVVINDKKTPVNSGTITLSYKPQVVSVSDYYSFGSEIAERSYDFSLQYRFGFQRQEKDNEIYGKGNAYYFKFREQDARIGRFWSVDPLAGKYPHNSPYAFAENDPITNKDLEGQERSHYLLTFNTDGKPQLKFLRQEDIIDRDWNWSKLKFETVKNQRREYFVHTGIFHTGVINGTIYKQEITFIYHNATEFIRESKALSKEKIQEKEVIYGLGDKLVAGLENVREETRAAGGVSYILKPLYKNVIVYRVFGGDAKMFGKYWTPINPETVKNYRYHAGLPPENKAIFMIEGEVNEKHIIERTKAKQIGSNMGGIDEFQIEHPQQNIEVIKVKTFKEKK